MMIHRILNLLGLGDGSLNGVSEWRRRHIRHDIRQSGVAAEVEINGRAYSIRDWSMGGICFDAAGDAPPAVGQDLEMNIRFRLPHETVTIRQPARVVRSRVRGGVATEFLPLMPDMRRRFQRVLDGLNAQTFVQSQVA